MKNLLAIIFLMSFTLGSFAQGLIGKLAYSVDKDEVLSLSLSISDEEEEEPVADLRFNLYSITPDTVVIGEITTDEDGKGVLRIAKSDLERMENRYEFVASYDGDEWDPLNISAQFKDISIEILTEEDEESKILTIAMNSWDETGEVVPIEEGEGVIFIQRLFSLLPIDSDVWTEEDGTYAFDFPNDLPGDAQGNLQVIFKMEGHEDYGSVEVAKEIPWGVPLADVQTANRALWSNHAPLWMVITFWLLMSAVWLYYFRVAFAIYRLNKSDS